MSSFLTPADAKTIDKAFREYKDAEQALHEAFLYAWGPKANEIDHDFFDHSFAIAMVLHGYRNRLV